MKCPECSVETASGLVEPPEMEWSGGDREWVCPNCGYAETPMPQPHDFASSWKPGMVWVICPNCSGSGHDGYWVQEYVNFRHCPFCGAEHVIDRERREG